MAEENLGVEAYKDLYPEKRLNKRIIVKYSGRFKGYNANIIMNNEEIRFGLSKEFLALSKEIRIGIMQHLLNKLFKTKKNTIYIDLYNSFMKKIADYQPYHRLGEKREETPEKLKKLFDKLNEEYFLGMMDQPVIKWGKETLTKLGHYEFGTDTIILSKILEEDQDLLEYVLYHELLHKKHRFKMSGNTTRTHTREFKKDEAKFRIPLKEIDRRLEALIRRKKAEKRKGKRTKRLRTILFWE